MAPDDDRPNGELEKKKAPGHDAAGFAPRRLFRGRRRRSRPILAAASSAGADLEHCAAFPRSDFTGSGVAHTPAARTPVPPDASTRRPEDRRKLMLLGIVVCIVMGGAGLLVSSVLMDDEDTPAGAPPTIELGEIEVQAN